MKNKNLTAIIAGIIAGLLVLAIGYWLYWVRTEDILPMVAEEQVQPVLAQVPNDSEWEFLEPVEIIGSSEASNDVDSISQIKGASSDYKRPDCVVKEISRPELGLSWRYQTCQNEQVSYRVDGKQVIEVVATPSARLEQVVMEVFEKSPTETMTESIEKRFVSRLTEVAQIGCVPKISTRMTLTDPEKEVWEIMPTGKYEQVANDLLKRSPSAQPCGTYGHTPQLRYFEYHPKDSLSVFIFVQYQRNTNYFNPDSIVIQGMKI